MPATPDIQFLITLESIIIDRLDEPRDGSYTSELAKSGQKRIAQKVGEEGVELAIAAVAGDRNEMINESADLVYHLLVLLTNQGIRLTDVIDTLEQRHAGD